MADYPTDSSGMRPLREILWVAGLWLAIASLVGSEPLVVATFNAGQGIVVAGRPQAAAADLAVLKADGNAIDDGVVTALAVGVAKPCGSGLGGKLVPLYYEAASGRTFAVVASDACGSAVEVER